jgi:hypothetical protein
MGPNSRVTPDSSLSIWIYSTVPGKDSFSIDSESMRSIYTHASPHAAQAAYKLHFVGAQTHGTALSHPVSGRIAPSTHRVRIASDVLVTLSASPE